MTYNRFSWTFERQNNAKTYPFHYEGDCDRVLLQSLGRHAHATHLAGDYQRHGYCCGADGVWQEEFTKIWHDVFCCSVSLVLDCVLSSMKCLCIGLFFGT